MDDKMKLATQIRIGIITLILYCLAILIYFMRFYKKFEPSYGEANELVKSIKRDDLIFFFIIALLICFLVAMFIDIIYCAIVLYNTPIISVNARLKSKESVMNIYGDHRGFSNVGLNYNLTFEIENGIEMNFRVVPKYYMTIIEGNIGILKYNQGVNKRFIDFDLKQIE